MKRTASALFAIMTIGLLGWKAVSATEPETVAGDGSVVAEILAQVVYDSRSGKAQERSHQIQERDLNAFLKDQLELQNPAGVEQVAVELLADNRFITWLRVDMDQIDVGNDTLTGMLLGSLLTGKQTLELEGQLDARHGQGTYTAQRAELNDQAIPVVLLNSLLKVVGERLEPPFDPTKPFRLPYEINTIEVSQGQVVLKTGSDSATP